MSVLRCAAVALFALLQYVVEARPLTGNGVSQAELIVEYLPYPEQLTAAASKVDIWTNAGSSGTMLDSPTLTQELVDMPFAADPKPDFEAIVTKELKARMPKIKEKCFKCIHDVAIMACQQAWTRTMQYCTYAFDANSKKACTAWKADPEKFLVDDILRASVNPIDGGKTWCWFQRKC